MPLIIKSPVLEILGLSAALLCAVPAFGAAPAAQPMTQPQPSVAGTAAILSSIVHPPLKIVDAAVLDADGRAIGTVARVEVSPAGVPLAVAVTPAGKPDQVQVLDAAAVSYDAATNRIVARPGSRGPGSRG